MLIVDGLPETELLYEKCRFVGTLFLAGLEMDSIQR